MAQERIAALYDLPMERFIGARNELAASLKAEGDEPGARTVKALRKPNLVAWTVNQVVRRRPDELAALLDLRDRLGGDAPDDLRTVSRERKALLSVLLKEAAAVLSESGRAGGGQTIERVSRTLQAAATHADPAVVLEGRLERELESQGLEGLGLEPALDDDETERADARRSAEELQRAAARALQKAESLETRARVAEEEAGRLARDALAARARADEAQTRAQNALEKL